MLIIQTLLKYTVYFLIHYKQAGTILVTIIIKNYS